MRKLIFISLLCSTWNAWAGGPKYNFKDPHLNDEFTNAYKDIGTLLKSNPVRVATMTISGTLTVPNGVNATDAAAFGQIPAAATVVNPTSYTPTTPTNLTLGNGTIVGAYTVNGKMLTFWVNITLGSTSSMNSSCLDFSVSIPAGYTRNATPMGTTDIWNVGPGADYTSGANNYVGCFVSLNSQSGAMPLVAGTQNGFCVKHNSPVAEGAGDHLTVMITIPVS